MPHRKTFPLSDDTLVDAMFTAAAIGHVIAVQATVSGAEGGCQAECGSAAAMAAAAYVQLQNGTDEQVISACGFVLMNSMGLACDPVDGLVEIPCVYRNSAYAAQALNAAQMALAGLPCPLDVDCLILAMKDVGSSLPASLRETGEGGLRGLRFPVAKTDPAAILPAIPSSCGPFPRRAYATNQPSSNRDVCCILYKGRFSL